MSIRPQSFGTYHSLFIDLHRILVPEWRLTDQEFVDENAKSPPVDCETVAGVSNDFRRKVLGCTAQRIRLP